jgi:hypothetical protein
LHRLGIDPHACHQTAVSVAAAIETASSGVTPSIRAPPTPTVITTSDPCFTVPPLGRSVRSVEASTGAYIPRLPSYTNNEDIWLRLGRTLTSSQYNRPRSAGLLHDEPFPPITTMIRTGLVQNTTNNTASSSSPPTSSIGSVVSVKSESTSISSTASSMSSPPTATFQSSSLCEFVVCNNAAPLPTSSILSTSNGRPLSSVTVPNGIGLTLTTSHAVYDRMAPLAGNTSALVSSSSTTTTLSRIPRKSSSSSSLSPGSIKSENDSGGSGGGGDDDEPEGNLLGELQTQQRLLASQMTIGNGQRERLLDNIISRGGLSYLIDTVIRARDDAAKRSQATYRYAAAWQIVRLALYRGVKDVLPGGSQAGLHRRERERAKAASSSTSDDTPATPPRSSSTATTAATSTAGLADIPRTRGQAVQRQLTTGVSVPLLTGTTSSLATTSSVIDSPSTPLLDDDDDDCEDYSVCCVCFSGDASDENPIVFW